MSAVGKWSADGDYASTGVSGLTMNRSTSWCQIVFFKHSIICSTTGDAGLEMGGQTTGKLGVAGGSRTSKSLSEALSSRKPKRRTGIARTKARCSA
jgi:hypothetical protein